MDTAEELPADELEDVEQNESNVTTPLTPSNNPSTILEEGTGIDDELDDEANVEVQFNHRYKLLRQVIQIR